jgi:polysaccharide export outer membrane protein
MIQWARMLMIVGLLLALAWEADAAEFGTPTFGGNAQVDSKQQKAQGGFSQSQRPQPGNTAQADAHASARISGTHAYTIGPLDVLDISVFGVPELSGTVEVGDNGSLQLPLLGETPAAGKTAEELQQDLTSRLGAEYLQNPQVRVTVKEFKSRSVIVSGDINTPGVYPLKGQTTLLQIVATAGGFKESSDSTVLVLRKSGGKSLGAKFDVSEIQNGSASDPILQPGDSIVAGRSAIKGAYNLLLKALPVAGVFALF